MSLGAGKFYPSIHSNRLIHFRVVGVPEPIPAYTGNLDSPVNPMHALGWRDNLKYLERTHKTWRTHKLHTERPRQMADSNA